jgi:glutamate---cysteine ligase / carboxylate-amine ligase
MRTVGVEEELMLFDAGSDVVAPLGEELAEEPSTEVEHEFKLEQAEIASEPTADLAELAADLRRRRAELVRSAARRGATVAALGTSPGPAHPTVTPDERYRRMHEQFGLVAREQLTCGAHVHVSVRSRSEGIAAINAARPWLSVLLAMSGNSPFWSGRDTGYASYRSILWGRWPTAGPTARFRDEEHYDRLVADLIASGAAMDDGMIYFDVRLSAHYPTVEFRVADVGQEVGDSVLVAGLCRALVATAVNATSDDPSVAVLRSAAWRAARYGVSGELFDVTAGRLRPAPDLVDHLLDVLTPALRHSGDLDTVHTQMQRVLRRGTGADLQRADLARRGRPGDVVVAAAARTASS